MKLNLKSIFTYVILGCFSIFIGVTLAIAIIEIVTGRNFPYLTRDNKLLFLAAIPATAALAYLALKYILRLVDSKMPRNLDLPVLAVLTVIPRIIWVFLLNVLPRGDFKTYHIIANAFAESDLINNKIVPLKYISTFPHVIGYPWFLSIFYKLFKPDVLTAQLINVLLSLAITLLLYYLGTKINERPGGLTAALLWVFWPSQIFFNSLVLTEVLHSFLMVSCIVLFIILTEACVQNNKKSIVKKIAGFISLGTLLAASNAVRPLTPIILVAFAIFYFILKAEKRTFQLGKKLLGFSAVIITYLVVGKLIGYATSNSIGMASASSPVGFNLYVGINKESNGKWNDTDSKLFSKLMADPEMKAEAVHKEFLRLSAERFKETRPYIVKLMYNKYFEMWGTDHVSIKYIKPAMDPQKPSVLTLQKSDKKLMLIADLYYYIVLMLCGAALIKRFKRPAGGIVLLPMLIIMGMTCLHLIVEVANRYHYPGISLLTLIAAYAFGSGVEGSAPTP